MPYVSPVRTPTVFFPFDISNTYSISNLMQSVFSELKTSSTRKSSLSSHQINVSSTTFRTPYQDKYEPTSTTKSFYSSGQENVSSPFVTKLSVSSHKTSDQSASVPHSILSSNTKDTPVNFVSSNNFVNS